MGQVFCYLFSYLSYFTMRIEELTNIMQQGKKHEILDISN